MLDAFEAQKFYELTKLKKKCLVSIEQSRKKYSEILDQISLAQQQLTKQRQKGLNVSKSLQSIKKAKKLLIAGDYSEAKQLVDEALKSTIDSSKLKKEIEEKLKKMEKEIDTFKKNDKSVISIEDQFKLAQETFKAADYEGTLEYLNECEQKLTELADDSDKKKYKKLAIDSIPRIKNKAVNLDNSLEKMRAEITKML